MAFAIFSAHFIRLTSKRFAALETLIIIGSTSHGRARLEESLASSGWRCLIAENLVEALTFESLSNVKVAVVSGKLSITELEELLRIARIAQVVIYDAQQRENEQLTLITDRLAGVVDTNSPSWAIDLTVRRAADLSRTLATETENALVDLSYRNLFHASVTLSSVQSLQELLNALCKEIAIQTCHGRAVIVLGDAQFRIQHAGAYSGEQILIPNLSSLLGKPLTPVLPDRLWNSMGKGFVEVPLAKHDHALKSQPLIIPLERNDGTVAGFLTLDLALTDDPPLAELSEPIALLLHHGVQAIEVQALRGEMKRSSEQRDQHFGERAVELKQAQDRFSRLVNLTNDIVYLTDDQGRLVYLNESFTRELGFTRENYLGTSLHNVLENLAVESTQNKSVLNLLHSQNEERLSGDLELFSKDGNRRAFKLTHNWIRQGDEVIAGQGVLRDASEQRDLLQRLAVSERLGMAGKLASGIAHEINNPLQAISAHLSGLTERIGKDEQAITSIGIVADSVERIRLIVRSLLDLHRIEPTPRSLIQLNDVVRRTHALLEPQLRQSGVIAEEHFDPQLPKVMAAAPEIEQVLINLVLNATQAMSAGGTIRLETAQVEKHVEIRVSDNGPGIPPEIMKKLFEPFATYREQGGGTGLGLYVSRHLITQHGGELRVSSEAGGGATFTIVLPLPGKQ